MFGMAFAAATPVGPDARILNGALACLFGLFFVICNKMIGESYCWYECTSGLHRMLYRLFGSEEPKMTPRRIGFYRILFFFGGVSAITFGLLVIFDLIPLRGSK